MSIFQFNINQTCLFGVKSSYWNFYAYSIRYFLLKSFVLGKIKRKLMQFQQCLCSREVSGVKACGKVWRSSNCMRSLGGSGCSNFTGSTKRQIETRSQMLKLENTPQFAFAVITQNPQLDDDLKAGDVTNYVQIFYQSSMMIHHHIMDIKRE